MTDSILVKLSYDCNVERDQTITQCRGHQFVFLTGKEYERLIRKPRTIVICWHEDERMDDEDILANLDIKKITDHNL